MKNKLKLIIFFLLISNFSFSQVSLGKNGTFSNKWYSGKLVLKNNDTLKGVVKFENSSTTKDLIGLRGVGGTNKIFFKKSKKSKKKVKYKKDEVEYFIVKTNSSKIAKYTFVPTKKNKSKLMQVLIEGKVSLYLKKGVENMYLDNGNSTTIIQNDKSLYYVKKSNEKYVSNRFFANIFKSFKKTAVRYFSDCKPLVQKINNGEYKSDQLFEIVKDYNNCE
ncbi:hypothetical protein [Ichthyenterobacterium magnum]|uniref:FecR family protein n=1 Tax=Ichthyenterobacterium magnum TaxID=1230530 RepID=A0A420DEJ7_9FLAO|nr:hypothetical protein [Ichthyenterobacterium magnum]RKE90254.1 hypothetical protein BXY80_2721 [Ichthyenterobacterium magnum]